METAVRLSNGGLSDRAELLILRGAYGFVFTVSDIFVVSDIRCVESIIMFVASAAVSAVRAWSALWQAAPAAAMATSARTKAIRFMLTPVEGARNVFGGTPASSSANL